MRRFSRPLLALAVIAVPLLAALAASDPAQTRPLTVSAPERIDAHSVTCRRLVVTSPDSPGRVEAVAYKGVVGLWVVAGKDSVGLSVDGKGRAPVFAFHPKGAPVPSLAFSAEGVQVHDPPGPPKFIPIDQLRMLAR